MYVYKQTESSLWTVGHYAPDGEWHPDSDHESKEAAASKVHYLNGGGDRMGDAELKYRFEQIHEESQKHEKSMGEYAHELSSRCILLERQCRELEVRIRNLEK